MVVRAEYEDYDRFVDALRKLKQSGVTRYQAFGPINLTKLEDLMPSKGSSVRIWATAALLFGIGAFFALCIATSKIYNIVTGGKPPVSNVPFIVIAYESAIGLASIAAFAGVLQLARLYPRLLPPDYDPSFSGSRFGIEVYSSPEEHDRLEQLLRGWGAVDVRPVPPPMTLMRRVSEYSIRVASAVAFISGVVRYIANHVLRRRHERRSEHDREDITDGRH